MEITLAALLNMADAAGSAFGGIEWGLPVAIALLVFGFALVFAEILIPSGGVLSIASAVFVLGSVIVAFLDGVTAGLAFLVVVLLLTPVVVIVAFKVFPHTPIGRRMIAKGEESSPDDRRAIAHDEKLLLGQVGTVVKPMRPGGMVDIGGDTYDAVTQGELLEPGTPVQVIEVSGNRMVVRALEVPL